MGRVNTGEPQARDSHGVPERGLARSYQEREGRRGESSGAQGWSRQARAHGEGLDPILRERKAMESSDRNNAVV